MLKRSRAPLWFLFVGGRSHNNLSCGPLTFCFLFFGVAREETVWPHHARRERLSQICARRAFRRGTLRNDVRCEE